ncbi:MAG: cytochrome c peroxidase [Bdellovibrionota bacterium]
MKNIGLLHFLLAVIVNLSFGLGCSEKGGVDAKDSTNLSNQIWQKLNEAETGAYAEPLSPELLAKHKAGLSLISHKIPKGYPEPYLPYGQLKNRTLDPGLLREPVLNESLTALGKTLFEDKSLSFSKSHGFSEAFGLSCQSCHHVEREFTDGEVLSKGIEGDFALRNTPTLWNAAYYSTLTWSNSHFPILEMQSKIPLFNDDPIEMGLRGKEQEMMANLSLSDHYQSLFHSAFQVDLRESVVTGAADYTLVTQALGAFERTLIRFDSVFDLYLQGLGRLDGEAKLGASLFYGLNSLDSGQTLTCAQCHSGILMTDSFQYVRDGVYFNKSVFHNEIRTPTLRFVAKTSPYFHDGSVNRLEDVLDFYERNGRAGAGVAQPAFTLTDGERQALLSFLNSL